MLEYTYGTQWHTAYKTQIFTVLFQAQALYSPFPGDQNILHLHLKGKDGKNGKTGPKVRFMQLPK